VEARGHVLRERLGRRGQWPAVAIGAKAQSAHDGVAAVKGRVAEGRLVRDCSVDEDSELRVADGPPPLVGHAEVVPRPGHERDAQPRARHALVGASLHG
jgi:hypothetical protein